MERWVGKVAVITGASAGIGLFTAEALVQHGMIVIGLARRKQAMEDHMKNVKGKGKFHAFECDITNNEDVINVFRKIENDFGGVHILINNAGLMSKGSTIDTTIEKIEQIINTNLLGLIYCTRQAIIIMKERNYEGHIINIGSYLGHKVLNIEGFPMNVYPATKFAVRGYSESLQNELNGTKIRVTHVSPGVVKTEFFETAGVNSAFLETSAALNAEDVTDAILYAISTKPHVHIPELTIRHLQDTYR